MQQDNQPKNMWILDGEITSVFPPRNGKGPTIFNMKSARRFTNTNGEDVEVQEKQWGLKTFNHNAVRKGAIVHAIGSVHTNTWKDKDGKDHNELEAIFNSIQEVGFNGQAAAGTESQEPMTQVEAISQERQTDEAPEDIPENFDVNDIPF